jgi:hypothetical protein
MSPSFKDAQNPLILRCHRLMDAFARSDDERDFYLDRMEGFIIFVDLDKSEEELTSLENELLKNAERYCSIPKLTFYETKKIMEGFVNEKVYDIDTKEKLLDIIQSKEAREHFLEFLYDHHSELEKWQQFYQERSRIRIIEWLRNHDFQFVFEEDLDLPKPVVEKLKSHLFQSKVPKELIVARKALSTKAETYYSNEALNPRPKRGRPPKQVAKVEIEPQFTQDIYMHVPSTVRPFLFIPDITSIANVTFSAKHDNEEEFLASLRNTKQPQTTKLDELTRKLASLRSLSSQVAERQTGGAAGIEGSLSEEVSRRAPSAVFEKPTARRAPPSSLSFDEEDEEEEFDVEEELEEELETFRPSAPVKRPPEPKASPVKQAAPKPVKETKPLKTKEPVISKTPAPVKPKEIAKEKPKEKSKGNIFTKMTSKIVSKITSKVRPAKAPVTKAKTSAKKVPVTKKSSKPAKKASSPSRKKLPPARPLPKSSKKGKR